MKNIGALAILMPATIKMAEKSDASPWPRPQPGSIPLRWRSSPRVMATDALPVREAYNHVEAPILIMRGALILVAAMAVTPFLNNAATALAMAPIGATFADEIGLKPDALLIAVAVGAGCNFLTSIGHQCNTLLMGPGGYRLGDYARLGSPLSLLVLVVGVPAIVIAWAV